MVKDAYEVNEMRKAVDATKHGFDRLLSSLPSALDKPRSERILEGAFNAVSRELGNAVGYDSIVLPALMPRSCTGCATPAW